MSYIREQEAWPLPGLGLPRANVGANPEWVDRGLVSLYEFCLPHYAINQVTGANGAFGYAAGVVFDPEGFTTTGNAADGVKFIHNLYGSSPQSGPFVIVIGCTQLSGSVAWSLMDLTLPNWWGWYSVGGTVNSTVNNSFDGALALGNGSIAFQYGGSNVLYGEGQDASATDTSALGPTVSNDSIYLGGSKRSTGVDNTAIARFTHLACLQGEFSREELRSLALYPGQLFAPQQPRIWVPVTVGGGASDTPVNPGAGALTLTGHAPTVARTAHQAVGPGAGVLTPTGYAPTVTQSAAQAVTAGAGAVTLTGHVPTVARTAHQAVAPGAGTVTVTGHAPTVAQSAAGDVRPGAGTVTVTGHAPTVSQPLAVAVGAGVLVVTGHAPTVAQPQAVQPAVGAIVLTGYAPTVLQTAQRLVAPTTGALVVTGHAPTITQSGGATTQPLVAIRATFQARSMQGVVSARSIRFEASP